jgi:micrococcal nuclease
MNKKREIFLLAFLVLLLIAVNYRFLDSKVTEFLEESDIAVVERVIDGDTIVVENNTHIRLLGINTPEKGEKYYSEAKSFLEMIILNKTVKLKYGSEKQDKYGRTLAYVLVDEKNVNKEMVDEGYANFYFPSGKDSYYNSFAKAWGHCLENNKYLCEKSQTECSRCVELKELNVKEQRIVLYNNCSFSCSLNGWTIKDEGRKKFVFPDFKLESRREISVIVGNWTDDADSLYWKGEEYVWTQTGDTMFLRDEEGKLVVWKSVNY